MAFKSTQVRKPASEACVLAENQPGSSAALIRPSTAPHAPRASEDYCLPNVPLPSHPCCECHIHSTVQGTESSGPVNRVPGFPTRLSSIVEAEEVHIGPSQTKDGCREMPEETEKFILELLLGLRSTIEEGQIDLDERPTSDTDQDVKSMAKNILRVVMLSPEFNTDHPVVESDGKQTVSHSGTVKRKANVIKAFFKSKWRAFKGTFNCFRSNKVATLD